MPHVFAQQAEYMSKNLHYRENVLLSLHSHNDRGCAIASTELGLLAGADRVEGTLFGNGERTGNADIVAIAMNMFSQGVDPKLDFTFMPEICEKYTEYTQMEISPRQPYAGSLVFAAFSGSHQDAIAKGMQWRRDRKLNEWNVPYLPIDPTDLGRVYEADVIRINSQSGKGGIGYLLETKYSLVLPPKMREVFGYHVKSVSDHAHKELSPAEVYEIFMDNYVNIEGKLFVREVHFRKENGITKAEVIMRWNGQPYTVSAIGNGSLDAVSGAIISVIGKCYTLDTYSEHALSDGSTSRAASYVSIKNEKGTSWGAGIDSDIVFSSVKALVSAINRMLAE